MEEGKEKLKLNEITKKHVFKAPDGYFDSLEDKINSRIHVRSGKMRVIANTWQYIGYAAAASITFVMILWFANGDRFKAATAEETLAQVSAEDLTAYLES